MLSIKEKLISDLAALKSLSNGFPVFRKGNSFDSLNNSNNVLDFTVDIAKTIVGFDELKAETIRFLTYELEPVEVTIKEALRLLLKNTYFCSTDAVIPDSYITNGFNIALSQIDFFEMLKIDPSTPEGQMLYGSDALDLNRFLYEVIQGTSSNWKNLFDVFYSPSGFVGSQYVPNVLNVKIDPLWQGQTLNSFISAFIDSVTIVDIVPLINRIIDGLYGTISQSLRRTQNVLEREEQLNLLIERFINLPDRLIDDSYYSFSNEELYDITEKAKNRSNGIVFLKECGFTESTLNFDDVLNLSQNLVVATLEERFTLLTQSFDTLTASATQNLDPINQTYGVLNFYEGLFKGIIRGIVNLILSPKIVFFFSTYIRLVTNDVGHWTFKEFVNQHRDLILKIVRDIVLPLIIKFLMKIILRELRKLIIEDKIENIKEQVKNYQLATLSLLGINSTYTSILQNL